MNEYREAIEPWHHLLVKHEMPEIIKPSEERAEKKKRIQEEERKGEINNTIPSTAFMKRTFANKDFYHQKHNELEKERCGDFDGNL
jgi:hypothetical protein